MKILYVILSCEKYKDTRQKWQRETWLKGQGFVYLDKPVGEETYNNAPYKYLEFFRLSSDYTWYFFCDDDTFVDTESLEIHLKLIENHEQPQMRGFKGGSFPIHNLNITWCSGGAGIAMNRELVKKIQTHLRNTETPLVTHETDISLAIWATMASRDLKVIDSKRFSPFNPDDAAKEGMRDCITYHYCQQQDFYGLHALSR